MANEPVITIVGNLTADPEMRFTSGGVAVASFTVASTPRKRNAQTDQWEDGEPMFVRCSAWRDYAENVAESLSKGMRVLVTGRLTVNRYQTQNGEQREGLELQVDEIGPSLRYAKAQVTKTSGGGNYNRGNQGGYGQNPGGQGAPSGQGGQGSYGGQASYNAPQGGSAYDPWSQQPQAPQGGSAFDDMPPF
ncbi:single-stranded DNA-binding protein [Actinotignum timonense]|uniref:Single-stranded DNA-binding protein n=3 Tax=Actinotignum TaxID=1653174 RepID=S2VP85_9ACTO|nr:MULTISPECIES: single-stranded DNA-binding protein [Actinotignum]AIE82953.1 single-stranded DNA-binding protein [Actinotignum schaalii]EPD27830.1 single-stranded DNA-binding protein [Actinotignum schaalii FB123-CNA-2]MDE1553404.1 single-stranded DNA-binding protein [Actinotignum sanguinis]MDE1564896.1 single-stranded DNA-binding protein [Actinotignum sanguinis]MDE1576639.1 single-stranded DNA-binding protein [Actinotignum sanguinis]